MKDIYRIQYCAANWNALWEICKSNEALADRLKLGKYQSGVLAPGKWDGNTPVNTSDYIICDADGWRHVPYHEWLSGKANTSN